MNVDKKKVTPLRTGMLIEAAILKKGLVAMWKIATRVTL